MGAEKPSRITGITPSTAQQLLQYLPPQHMGRPHALTPEEALHVTLLYLRHGLTLELLAYFTKVDTSTVWRAIRRVTKALEAVPLFGEVSQAKGNPAEESSLRTALFDCTEQRIQRPATNQREYYSGKKRCHTVKTEIKVDARTGKITGVGLPAKGRVHDIVIHREGSLASTAKPTDVADKGYQGSGLKTPVKKPRGRSLTCHELIFNSELNHCRIAVEHAFARIKKFALLRNTWRCHLNLAWYGKVFRLACTLCNWNMPKA